MSGELYIRVDDAGRHQPYRLVNGLYKLDVGQPFATPREALDYVKANNGEAPRPTSAPDLARAVRVSTDDADRRDEAPASTEAPGPQEASTSGCAGCGGPLPPGRHGQRRLTCSAACRRTAARRAAAEAARVDTDAISAPVTPSRPSEAICPHPDWRLDYYHGGEPIPGAPLGAMRMQPICTECGEPVQVGASPIPDPTASAAPSAHRLLGSARDARPEPVSEGAIGVPIPLGL